MEHSTNASSSSVKQMDYQPGFAPNNMPALREPHFVECSALLRNALMAVATSSKGQNNANSIPSNLLNKGKSMPSMKVGSAIASQTEA
jgi:hypothetical protein